MKNFSILLALLFLVTTLSSCTARQDAQPKIESDRVTTVTHEWFAEPNMQITLDLIKNYRKTENSVDGDYVIGKLLQQDRSHILGRFTFTDSRTSTHSDGWFLLVSENGNWQIKGVFDGMNISCSRVEEYGFSLSYLKSQQIECIKNDTFHSSGNTFEIHRIQKSLALQTCQNEISAEPAFMTCADANDLLAIESFYEILSVSSDVASRFQELLSEGSGNGLQHVNALASMVPLSIKKYKSGYIVLSQSPQYIDENNIRLSYFGLSSNNNEESISILGDFSNYQAPQEKYFVPDDYYKRIIEEFKAGIFSNPKLQKFYDDFMSFIGSES